MTIKVPDSHLHLLTGKYYGVLTTLMPDGQPQSSVVWVDYDGEHVLINTTRERQKTRNMQRDPRITLLVLNPADTNCFIEIRGTCIEVTSEGAIAHADKLAQWYTDKPRFYGGVYPAERRAQETRVLVKIAIHKITMNGEFS